MLQNNTAVAVLEFLRNLTSQILLFSITVIIGIKLNFRVIDLSNTLTTSAFFIMAFVLIYALVANFMIFLGKTCQHPGWFENKARRYKTRGYAKGRRLKYLVMLTLRKEKALVAKFFFVLLVTIVGYAAVYIAMIPAALNIYSAFYIK